MGEYGEDYTSHRAGRGFPTTLRSGKQPWRASFGNDMMGMGAGQLTGGWHKSEQYYRTNIYLAYVSGKPDTNADGGDDVRFTIEGARMAWRMMFLPDVQKALWTNYITNTTGRGWGRTDGGTYIVTNRPAGLAHFSFGRHAGQ